MTEVTPLNIDTPFGLKRLRVRRAQWKTNVTYDERRNLRFISAMVFLFTIAFAAIIIYSIGVSAIALI